MAKSAEPTRGFDAEFEPYAREIGFLLRNWNDLQEALADLFAIILKDTTGVSRAIWYAVPNDRFQRRMLENAAAHVLEPTGSPDNAVVLREIRWILCKANSLGGQRDAAAHSPVMIAAIEEPFEFIARHFFGNPLAKTLQGKKLFNEFRLYRERANVLHVYTVQIDVWFRMGQKRETWPKRPFWPNRAPPEAPKFRNSTIHKGPPPPRRSPPGEGRTRRQKK
jgi:hypothetical protein